MFVILGLLVLMLTRRLFSLYSALVQLHTAGKKDRVPYPDCASGKIFLRHSEHLSLFCRTDVRIVCSRNPLGSASYERQYVWSMVRSLHQVIFSSSSAFELLPLSARVKIGLMENLNRSSLFSFFFRASSLWADSTFRISCARHQLICSCQCYPDNGHEEELFLLFRVDACLVVSGMRMIQSSRIYFNINHSDVLHCTLCFIIRVLQRKKSNIQECIGRFQILRWQMAAMASTIFLSEGIEPVLWHCRVISFLVHLSRIRNRVVD